MRGVSGLGRWWRRAPPQNCLDRHGPDTCRNIPGGKIIIDPFALQDFLKRLHVQRLRIADDPVHSKMIALNNPCPVLRAPCSEDSRGVVHGVRCTGTFIPVWTAAVREK